MGNWGASGRIGSMGMGERNSVFETWRVWGNRGRFLFARWCSGMPGSGERVLGSGMSGRWKQNPAAADGDGTPGRRERLEQRMVCGDIEGRKPG